MLRSALKAGLNRVNNGRSPVIILERQHDDRPTIAFTAGNSFRLLFEVGRPLELISRLQIHLRRNPVRSMRDPGVQRVDPEAASVIGSRRLPPVRDSMKLGSSKLRYGLISGMNEGGSATGVDSCTQVYLDTTSEA